MNALSLPWTKILAFIVVVWERINEFCYLSRKASMIKVLDFIFAPKEENLNIF